MDGSPPQVSVVVATHNRAARLARLLSSLREQRLPAGSFEVIVVDDASTDETRFVLDEERRRGDLDIHTIHRPDNGGPGVARNDGWRAARAPLVGFTDDDCEADPAWLAVALAAHAEHPGAVLQGRTDPIPRERHLLGPLSRTREIHRLGPQYETCNIFYPRSLLERLEGFDTGTFGMWGEDTDLAWRAIASGAPTRFLERAVVFHAVDRLTPRQHMRGAYRWAETVKLFRRHPELRRAQLFHRYFWHGNHWLLFRFIVATALARHLPLPLVNWLRSPYILNLFVRMRNKGGGPLVVPYFLVYDLVEMAAFLRASARHRTLVI